MPSLRQYRDRITSVKSTRKITSAMKMVAASKLKRAQDQAVAGKPYARGIAQILARVSEGISLENAPRLLQGTGDDQRHLLVVISSDRGLCGGFNGNLVRFVRQEMERLGHEGKHVTLITVGRKARDGLRRFYERGKMKSFTGFGSRKYVAFADADKVTQEILGRFDAGQYDVCSLIFNEFQSVLVQKPVSRQVIPCVALTAENQEPLEPLPYEFEPDQAMLLDMLLPRYVGVKVYQAMLESGAGEQAARMTAMDSATRNAGEMIKTLSLEYNRARQAHITKELIEIISGAEALG
jgi:F-type H+-transporting ATPase subunit gamma